MQVQINTDNQVTGDDDLRAQGEAIIANALGRFSDRITRVEVHLSDESSAAKSNGMDKRCLMEARVTGRQPVAVTNDSETVEQAMAGAARKLRTVLASTFDKLDKKKGATPMGDMLSA